MTAAEALLRWQHATRGLVPPAEFIALAEESGADRRHRRVGARDRLRAGRAWAASGPPIHISVNVSARQFDDPAAARRPATRCTAPAWTATSSCSRSPRPRSCATPRPPPRSLRELARSASARDRRLRHRLLVARLPAAAPGRRAQDRPHVHRRARHARTSRRADPDARPARPQPRPAHDRRGHRGRSPARPPARARLRPRARATCLHRRSKRPRLSACWPTGGGVWGVRTRLTRGRRPTGSGWPGRRRPSPAPAR